MSPDRVTLRELTDANRDEIVALTVAPDQEHYVASVAQSLEDAAEYPDANPWYRAVYAGDEPVGFVMLSWNCVPDPPSTDARARRISALSGSGRTVSSGIQCGGTAPARR